MQEKFFAQGPKEVALAQACQLRLQAAVKITKVANIM